MPVPMMLAMTIEHAVTNPTRRAGGGCFTVDCSARILIGVSTIAKSARCANCFECTFEFMAVSCQRSGEEATYSRSIVDLSEVIPGVTLQAA
jgi:hypothetical protein